MNLSLKLRLKDCAMATTINEIIKDSLELIKAEHLNLTPDNYAKVFCKVAKQKGVIVEDCQKVDK